MKIIIETIPHSEQRYDTVGDWQWGTGEHPNDILDLTIKVSAMWYWRHTMLIIVHELVEAFLCKGWGVDEKKVDEFDMNWEPHHGLTEPGEDRDAPYYLAHQIASGVERIVAANLDVIWAEYETAVGEAGKIE